MFLEPKKVRGDGPPRPPEICARIVVHVPLVEGTFTVAWPSWHEPTLWYGVFLTRHHLLNH